MTEPASPGGDGDQMVPNAKSPSHSVGGWWIVPLMMPALLVAGCVTGPGNGPGGPSMAPPGSTETSVADRDGEDPGRAEQERLEALYWDRIQEARGRFTEADVHFMTAMIGHHAQALVMTDLASARASDPSVRTLAARIRRSQEDEIALMQQWLRVRGQEVPEFHIEGVSLVLHGPHVAHDHGEMPGMLSDEQMAELARATGADFDRLFLRCMIEHHQGAVEMVHELFTTDGAGQDPDIFRFASDVQVDQRTEVARMERMLQEMAPQEGTPITRSTTVDSTQHWTQECD